MKPMHARHRRQGGFSLIELAIVIAIGILLIIAGVTLGSKLLASSNVTAEVENLGALATNLRNLYQRQYAGITAQQAIQLNLVPPDLVNNGQIVGHWGPITLAPGNVTGGAQNTAAVITLTNIPATICAELAPQLASFSDQLLVNNQPVKSPTNPTPTRSSIALPCGAGGGGQGGGNNTVAIAMYVS